jgi:hypothetical protein
LGTEWANFRLRSTRPKPPATGLAPLVRSWPLLYRIWILQTEKRSVPADGGQDPSYLHGPKTTGARQIAGGTDGRHRNPNRPLGRFTHIYCFGFPMLNGGERMRNPAPKNFWLPGRHFAGSFCKSSKGSGRTSQEVQSCPL